MMKLFPPKAAPGLVRTFVAYLILSLILLLSPPGWTGPVRAAALFPVHAAQAAFLGSLSPVERCAHRLADLWRATGEAQELRDENTRLRAQLYEEANRRYAAESRLAQLGQLPAAAQESAIAVSLVSYDASGLRRSAVFDKGSAAGVAPNSPVLWNRAVIGRVDSAGPWTCRAVLVGDRSCRIGVRCLRSRAQGVLEGIGGGMAAVKYIGASADNVRAGNVFVTSGVDGIFPAGLLVGDCTEASVEAGAISKWIVVKPALDPALLEDAVILPPDSAGRN